MNIVEIKNTNISIDTKNVLEAINFDLKKGEMKYCNTKLLIII